MDFSGRLHFPASLYSRRNSLQYPQGRWVLWRGNCMLLPWIKFWSFILSACSLATVLSYSSYFVTYGHLEGPWAPYVRRKCKKEAYSNKTKFRFFFITFLYLSNYGRLIISYESLFCRNFSKFPSRSASSACKLPEYCVCTGNVHKPHRWYVQVAFRPPLY
jgi:hypothetical protein